MSVSRTYRSTFSFIQATPGAERGQRGADPRRGLGLADEVLRQGAEHEPSKVRGAFGREGVSGLLLVPVTGAKGALEHREGFCMDAGAVARPRHPGRRGQTVILFEREELPRFKAAPRPTERGPVRGTRGEEGAREGWGWQAVGEHEVPQFVGQREPLTVSRPVGAGHAGGVTVNTPRGSPGVMSTSRPRSSKVASMLPIGMSPRFQAARKRGLRCCRRRRCGEAVGQRERRQGRLGD